MIPDLRPVPGDEQEGRHPTRLAYRIVSASAGGGRALESHDAASCPCTQTGICGRPLPALALRLFLQPLTRSAPRPGRPHRQRAANQALSRGDGEPEALIREEGL